MHKLVPIVVALVAAGGLVASACTINSTTTNNTPEGGGDDVTQPGDDSGIDTGTTEDTGTDVAVEAAAPQANIRLANLSPDSTGSGLDFCVAPHGTTTWTGPQLASAVGDAGTLSLAFPAVTTYFGIDPGQYDIEIVSGAVGTTCASPMGAAITNLPNLTANNYFTIAFVGDTTVAGTDQALTAIGFADDIARTDGNVNVRFLNADPALGGTATADFGTGGLGNSTFNPIETALTFGTVPTVSATDAGAIDTSGYVDLAATLFASATELSAHVTGQTTDTATVMGLTLAANSSNTVILINGKTGATAANFLVCQGDGTVSTTSLMSTCAVH
jgi:hypothetical protein